jgi:hypothetical protein
MRLQKLSILAYIGAFCILSQGVALADHVGPGYGPTGWGPFSNPAFAGVQYRLYCNVGRQNVGYQLMFAKAASIKFHIKDNLNDSQSFSYQVSGPDVGPITWTNIYGRGCSESGGDDYYMFGDSIQGLSAHLSCSKPPCRVIIKYPVKKKNKATPQP